MSNTPSVETFASPNIAIGRSAANSIIASRKALGLCWIVYGLARILLAVWLFAFQTTATLMFGALLTRVPNPFTLMDNFHLFYAAIILYSVVCGALATIAGLALLAGWSSAYTLALCAAFLSLPELPLGLILGVYTIARLLPSDHERARAS